MMRYSTDFLVLPPPFMPPPPPLPPDIPFPGPASRLSQSLLHLHVVGSTPQFTPIGGSIPPNWLSGFPLNKFAVATDLPDDKTLLGILQRLKLTEKQLWDNSFPRWIDADRRQAVVNPSFFENWSGRKEIIPDQETKRKCVRCHANYRLPIDGRKRVDFCIHHTEPAIYSSDRKIHPCCGRAQGVAGCQHSESHVTDTMRASVLHEFQPTPAPTGPSDPRSDTFFALDCEFVYTTVGKEAARVTVVDRYGKEVLDCVFRPEHEIVDPNTRYSGLTINEIESSNWTLNDVRKLLFEKINSDTLLIGHGLENDLKTLRIVHSNVIDTSVLFLRSDVLGCTFKQSLKSLAREHLDMEIQADPGGHDSGEDAWAAMQLVLKVAVLMKM